MTVNFSFLTICKKNVKNWFTILCKTMHFTLHFNSQVINSVYYVNALLIDNDLFHIVNNDRVTMPTDEVST